MGNNFISEQITQLPLEARNLVDLLSLQPGSTHEGYVTGARADQSNVTLDGVDINNAQIRKRCRYRTSKQPIVGRIDSDRGQYHTGPVLRLNSEAIEEFRVTTANGNANQGRSSGSQMNLVTKAGTNTWHGAASSFIVPADSRRTTGSTITRPTRTAISSAAPTRTGPQYFRGWHRRSDREESGISSFTVMRDGGTQSAQPQTGKLFRWRILARASTIGLHTILRQTWTADSTALASLDLAGNQGAYSEIVGGVNQTALDALADAAAKYPANDVSVGDGLNTRRVPFNSPTPIKLNSHVAKLDFNLTTNQTAFLRVNVLHDHQTLPKWLPDTISPQVWNHPWGLAGGHTWTIGNRWVNNFRYGYTRQAFTQGATVSEMTSDFRFVFQPNGEQHTAVHGSRPSTISPMMFLTSVATTTFSLGSTSAKSTTAVSAYANAFDLCGD